MKLTLFLIVLIALFITCRALSQLADIYIPSIQIQDLAKRDTNT